MWELLAHLKQTSYQTHLHIYTRRRLACTLLIRRVRDHREKSGAGHASVSCSRTLTQWLKDRDPVDTLVSPASKLTCLQQINSQDPVSLTDKNQATQVHQMTDRGLFYESERPHKTSWWSSNLVADPQRLIFSRINITLAKKLQLKGLKHRLSKQFCNLLLVVFGIRFSMWKKNTWCGHQDRLSLKNEFSVE